jgi:ubiquinone/menaquinone biosynthesis C-methylase UbiE
MNENLNKELYSEKLFNIWSQKLGLLPSEEYLINQYFLNKESKIIEAGTGGGRIIFEIEKLGFTKLEAFDFVENMITFCKEKKIKFGSNIKFRVADATKLNCYESNSFDYLIYLQQVLCFVDKDLFPQSLREAHRIGNENSVYIFSFLNWESKFYNPFLNWLVNLFRVIRNEKKVKHQLPWLIINGKFNWKFLNSNQPQNLWFKKENIIKILNDNGFNIIELITGENILNKHNSKSGHLYIICKKNNL